MTPMDAMELRWIALWTLVFGLMIVGVVFFFFGVTGQVPWGRCDVTRAPRNVFWEPEYKNDTERPLCPATTGARWGCAVGGIGMIALSLGGIYVRAHAT